MPEQIVQLQSAGLVGCDHLAIKNGVVDLQYSRHLAGERVEAAQLVAVA